MPTNGLIGVLEHAAQRVSDKAQQYLLPRIGSLVGALGTMQLGDRDQDLVGRSITQSATHRALEALANQSARVRSYPPADLVAHPNPTYFGHVKPYFVDHTEAEPDDAEGFYQPMNPLSLTPNEAAGFHDMKTRRSAEQAMANFARTGDPWHTSYRYEHSARFAPLNPFLQPDSAALGSVVVATPAGNMQRLNTLGSKGSKPWDAFGPASLIKYDAQMGGIGAPAASRGSTRQEFVRVNGPIRNPSYRPTTVSERLEQRAATRGERAAQEASRPILEAGAKKTARPLRYKKQL